MLFAGSFVLQAGRCHFFAGLRLRKENIPGVVNVSVCVGDFSVLSVAGIGPARRAHSLRVPRRGIFVGTEGTETLPGVDAAWACKISCLAGAECVRVIEVT
jgi:hypothetical protein